MKISGHIADSDSSSSSSDESHSDGNDSSQESEEPNKKEEEEGVPRKRRKLTLDETEIRIPLEHGYDNSSEKEIVQGYKFRNRTVISKRAWQ